MKKIKTKEDRRYLTRVKYLDAHKENLVFKKRIEQMINHNLMPISGGPKVV